MDTKEDLPVFVIQKSRTHTLPLQNSEMREDLPVLKFFTLIFTKPSSIVEPAYLPPHPPACNVRVRVIGLVREQVGLVVVELSALLVLLSDFGPSTERYEDVDDLADEIHRDRMEDGGGGGASLREGKISV